MIIRSTETTDLIELSLWAREYHATNSYPCKFDKRFAIGFYQIYQGIIWEGDNRFESFASAAIHFLITLEALNLSAETHVVRDLCVLDSREPDWKALMLSLSRAQQHILYRYQLDIKKATSRSTRFNPDILTADLGRAITMLFGAIPSARRCWAILDSTEIMTRKL